MSTAPLRCYDHACDLREQLAEIDGERLLECLRILLGPDVCISDIHSNTVLGREPTSAQRARHTIQGETGPLGYLETSPLEVLHLPAAATLLELLFKSICRYHIITAPNLESLHADYARLQYAHATLAENMEQRVKEQVQTLNAAQRQLYQAEKLASVGQLAAGVAHEINNPIGFITSNLNTARSYVQKLTETFSFINGTKDLEHATAVLAQQDIALMLEDFKALLAESSEGAGRIMRIVADLKGFSHIDRAEEEPTDINQKIIQVCNIVRNTIRGNIVLSTSFQDIPLVSCHPGQLGQVIVNMLLNASQAMASHGHIHVRTELLLGEICIRINDDGCGIPQHVLPRIFDPFFTTKDVGQGTGLGLSVSHDIIQNHGGRIEIQSEVGTGSTFSIYLPLEKSGGCT